MRALALSLKFLDIVAYRNKSSYLNTTILNTRHALNNVRFGSRFLISPVLYSYYTVGRGGGVVVAGSSLLSLPPPPTAKSAKLLPLLCVKFLPSSPFFPSLPRSPLKTTLGIPPSPAPPCPFSPPVVLDNRPLLFPGPPSPLPHHTHENLQLFHVFLYNTVTMPIFALCPLLPIFILSF